MCFKDTALRCKTRRPEYNSRCMGLAMGGEKLREAPDKGL